MLLHRVLVALVGAPALLAIIILGGAIGNLALFAAIAGLGLNEYYRMALKDDSKSGLLFTLMGLALFIIWGLAIPTPYIDQLIVFSFLAAFFFIFLYILLFRPSPIETVAQRVSASFFGLVYVPFLAFFFVLLQAFEGGWRYIVMALVIVWMSDTGAYFAGRAFGRHKLYPKVSPKKTWEGFAGGVIASVIGAVVAAKIVGIDWPTEHLIAIGGLMSIIGALGDLCESLLKRSYGVKDSGSILPGHGGILDRFDALLFAVPVMYYYIVLFRLMG